MYSSSDGTFLSETNGCRLGGGAIGKTDKKKSDGDESVLYGNTEMTCKLFPFWPLNSIFDAY